MRRRAHISGELMSKSSESRLNHSEPPVRDLRGIERQAETPKSIRIIGAIVAVAIFGLLAFYVYQQGQLNAPPKQIVTDQDLPSPSPPVFPKRT